jgi:ATP/maltotriose-dependent transcriptional regulator MalT
VQFLFELLLAIPGLLNKADIGRRPKVCRQADQALVISTKGQQRLGVLIETKLHAPVARKDWVERRELIQYMANATAKLVLVDAPAGFGKTTVVAQWRSSPTDQRRFAWVSLDRGDDDPGRLWRHVTCALNLACPDFDSEKILRALQTQAPDFSRTVLPLLVNEMASLPEPVVLALDDYHLIKERSCHEQMTFLLDHLPSSTQVVILTRADPPLPLARMRAAGEMAEIRARELRFELPQAAALIRSAAAIELIDDDLAELVERTEGWPAGLYLAALSLRGHPSPGAFVRQFAGDNRFIVDFLVEDVLSKQPDDVREFLMRTSILARFCAPLCDAVTGSADTAAIIEVLERENLFLVPLDEKRQWYRYHHLFAQVLRAQLAKSEPDIMPALHERASAWHQVSGSADEAITHALAAGDVDGATDLIARHYYLLFDSGQIGTVRRWLRLLGDDQIAASPLAAHCAAWTAALAGNSQTGRHLLPVIEAAGDAGPLPDGMRSFRFSAALFRATFGFEGLGPMRQAGLRAVRLETDPASPWYALAHSAIGAALYWTGEFDLAAAYTEKALSSEAAIALVRMRSTAVMALLAVEADRLAQAEELARAALDIVSDPGLGLDEAPQSSFAYTAMGAVLAAQGKLEAARSDLEHALRLRRKWMALSPWPTLEVLLRMALVLADLGDAAGAAALLGEARQVLDSLPDGAGAQLARLEQLERRLAHRPAISLGEPITEREREVLRLLQGTLSLRDIGRELYLSPNTIKSHTRALYRKLGASDRQDAVAKARELGVI